MFSWLRQTPARINEPALSLSRTHRNAHRTGPKYAASHSSVLDQDYPELDRTRSLTRRLPCSSIYKSATLYLITQLYLGVRSNDNDNPYMPGKAFPSWSAPSSYDEMRVQELENGDDAIAPYLSTVSTVRSTIQTRRASRPTTPKQRQGHMSRCPPGP